MLFGFNLEILILPLLFIFGFLLFLKDKKHSVTTLLVLSLFLHKEVFSIYMWDILPIRIVMLSLLGYVFYEVFKYLRKSKTKHKVYEDIHNIVTDPFLLALTVLWFIRGISIVFTKNLSASLFLFGFFTTIVALGYYLYFYYKNSPDNVLGFIKTYIFLVFLACVFGYIQLAIFYAYDFTIGALWSVPGHTPRVGSVFWDVNHFGALVASLMPILGILIIYQKTWKTKIAYSGMFVVMLSILLLTNSRTAWMAAFFAFLTFITVLLLKKYRLKGVYGLLLGIFLLSLPLLREYSIKSSPFRAYIKNYFHYRIDSFDSHILLIQGTFQVFEQYPILGGGYGGFFEHFIKTKVAAEYLGRDPAGLNTRVPAHTIWGEQLSETGIVGFAAYLGLMFVIIGTLFYASFTAIESKDINVDIRSVLREVFATSKRSEHSEETMQMLLTAAMGSTMIGLLIGGIFYSYKAEFFWLIFFLYFLYGVGVLGKRFDFGNIAAFYFRSETWTKLLIGTLAFILIFWGLGSTHLLPWDEAIYAEIAKNMLESGDYIRMHWWPNKIWYEKPPLTMWLMAFSMKYLGINSWAIRLPSALFGFLTILLTYDFGKKLYNKTVGLISAFVLLTTFQFLYYARASMHDVILTFFVTLSLYLYWTAHQEVKYKYWILAGISAGFAVMVKGVVGFLPFLVITVHEVALVLGAKKRAEIETVKKIMASFMTSALVFMPWHILMYLKFGPDFIQNYIGYHVLERATTEIEDKGKPWYWYFIVLKVSMRVWFIALLAAFPISVVSLFTNVRQYVIQRTPFRVYSYRKDYFLVVWAICIFVFFSLAKSKLVWYIIPVYPALALIVGLFIERVIRSIAPKSILVKALALYFLILGGLTYLYVEKKLVYTGDLTYKQALLIEEKDRVYGAESKLYADRIEVPLLLFYSDGPFEVVDFGPLERILRNNRYNEPIIFITKESRFREYSKEHPELIMEARQDEWVLGYKPSLQEQDERKISDNEEEIKRIEKSISQDIEKGKEVSEYTYFVLDQLKKENEELRKTINENTNQVSKDPIILEPLNSL